MFVWFYAQITEPELVQQPQPQPRPRAPPAVPAAAVSYDDVPSSSTSAAALSPEQMAQAQKLCKYASSALTYDDVPTAIDNLQKALHLLQTGVAKWFVQVSSVLRALSIARRLVLSKTHSIQSLYEMEDFLMTCVQMNPF